MERLIIIENGEEIVFNIESRVVTIGRSSKNDIPIKDRNASRRHCNIIKVGDSWFAVDCDSQNGTLVNQKPIKKQELEDGDKISVGAAEIIFMIAQEKPLQTEESMLADSPIKKHPLQDEELEVKAPPKKEVETPKKEEVEVPVKQEEVSPPSEQPAPPPVPPVPAPTPPMPPASAAHPKEISLNKSSKPSEPVNNTDDVEGASQSATGNRSVEMRNRRSATAAKQVGELYKTFTAQFAQQVVGYDYVARLLFIALINNEHCLLTGPPGAGKLFIVRTVSELLGLSVQRVSNVGIENHIENSSKYNLETLFSNNLNFIDHNFQAPENVMTLIFDFLQNQKMPTERKTSNFQQVNTIIAGNLPSKQTSSQMMQYKDAFMFDVPLDYLGIDLETSILKQNIGVINRAKKPMNFTRCFGYFQMLMANSVVSDEVLKFIATIVHHSRPYQSQCEDVKQYFLYGCGRKAGLSLLRAAQTHALLDNRKEVSIEDVSKMSYYVLHHRVVINEEGKKAKKSKKQIIESLIKFAKEN
ncbi:FHA domain-containing protein [Candidatus Uabimicrobium amorphum]|uniref:ATPase AAA n=1 Tax=Uabimicrobium amorphum TaxID=2596890 RepID=A0A5S9F0Q0_UABAM|nr:FHA domain-containing protein [Candidatus Uabimicrobium amorphum]BBM81845.1 ATPase AAA [Candidatus Uabimicrobium amorphum]